MKRAADILVDTLALHGVDRVYCVPGESYLSVLDSLHGNNAIQVVSCRHEGGAGFMAVADAKLTGTPGSTEWPGGEVGSHTDELLQKLGLDKDAIANFRARGIV